MSRHYQHDYMRGRVRDQLLASRPTYPPSTPSKKPKVAPKQNKKLKVQTKVMTKKKLNQGARNIGGESITMAKYTVRKLPKVVAKLSKSLQSNFYYLNGSQRCTGTPGIQQINTILSTWSYTDLGTCITQIPNSNSTSKMITDMCSVEMYLTNASQGTAKVYIYDVITRKDVNTLPDSMWATGITDAGGAGGSYKDVGVSPFTSPQFTTFFKVLKISKVMLLGGYSHLHKFQNNQHRIFDNEYLHGTASGYLGNITHHIILVAHGMPANDATTKTQVSTGETAIDVVWKKAYTYKVLELSRAVSNAYTQNLPTSFTVSESIVVPGSGAIAASEGDA